MSNDQDRKNREARKGILENLSLISYLGISMIIPIFLCILAGRWLDERFGTGPLFLFIFIILGALTSFRNLFKIGTRGYKKPKGRD